MPKAINNRNMKKILLIVAVLLFGGSTFAQNVIGDPVYYSDSTQYRPGHGMGYENTRHVRPYRPVRQQKGFDFNQVFAESRLMFGGLDAAWGVELAYVPGDWGGYVSNMWGVRYDYMSAGAIYRLSGSEAEHDWQLYGGLLFGPGMGCEGGVRLAFDNFGRNNFSWWSASVGFGSIQGYGFVKLGLSIGLSAITLIDLL